MKSRLRDLRRCLREGRTTAVEIVEQCLEAVEATAHLNAWVTVDAAGALAAARRVDEQQVFGPLAGVPVAIKENLWIRGQPLTAGSRILTGVRAPADATAVARLRAAGAIIVGQTNMDEFGMGSSTELGQAGPVDNPHAPGRVAGGSSGGSAASVAAEVVPVALGSDTGGSVRQPAALCGVVGWRPTWGRVSRRGLVAFASSLDTVGPIATSVVDAAEVLAVIAGRDRADATSSGRDLSDLRETLEGLSAESPPGRRPLAKLRVGVPPVPVAVTDRVSEGVDRAAKILRDAGAELVDVDLPHARFALSTYLVLSAAEASSNLARYDGVRYGRRAPNADDLDDLVRRSRREGLGPEVQRRILMGTFVLSHEQVGVLFDQAARIRTLIIQDYTEAFAKCDLLLGPTTAEPAFLRGLRTAEPLAMYRSDELTVGPSLAGLPALSMPLGHPQENLPLGIQLVAPWWKEAHLVRVGTMIEAATP